MWAVRLLIVALVVVPVLSTAVLVPVDPLLVRPGAVWLMPLVSIGAPLAGVAMLLLALAEPDRTARLPLTLLQTVSSLLVVALSVGLLAPLLVVALLVATLLMVALHAGSEVFHRVHDAAVTALVTLLTVSSAALVVALLMLVLLALVARLLAVLVLLIVLLSLLGSMLLALLVVLTLLMALLSLLVPVLLALLMMAPLMLVAPHAGNDVFDRVGDAPLVTVLSTTSLSTACLVMLSPVCPLAASIDALRVAVPVVSCLLPFVSVLTEVMWEVCHGSWFRTAVVDAIVQRVGDRTRTTATPTERL